MDIADFDYRNTASEGGTLFDSFGHRNQRIDPKEGAFNVNFFGLDTGHCRVFEGRSGSMCCREKFIEQLAAANEWREYWRPFVSVESQATH